MAFPTEVKLQFFNNGPIFTVPLSSPSEISLQSLYTLIENKTCFPKEQFTVFYGGNALPNASDAYLPHEYTQNGGILRILPSANTSSLDGKVKEVFQDLPVKAGNDDEDNGATESDMMKAQMEQVIHLVVELKKHQEDLYIQLFGNTSQNKLSQSSQEVKDSKKTKTGVLPWASLAHLVKVAEENAVDPVVSSLNPQEADLQKFIKVFGEAFHLLSQNPINVFQKEDTPTEWRHSDAQMQNWFLLLISLLGFAEFLMSKMTSLEGKRSALDKEAPFTDSQSEDSDPIEPSLTPLPQRSVIQQPHFVSKDTAVTAQSYQKGYSVSQAIPDRTNPPMEQDFMLAQLPSTVQSIYHNWVDNSAYFSQQVLRNAQIRPFSFSYVSGDPTASRRNREGNNKVALTSLFGLNWHRTLSALSISEAEETPTYLTPLYVSYLISTAVEFARTNPDFAIQREKYPNILKGMKLLDQLKYT